MATVTLDEAQTKNVLRQVEFYFSDSNLPRDNFLRKAVEESEDGLVNLNLICSFSRMRKHLELGELKPDEVPEETVLAVAEVLRKSPSLKVSEDGKRIGRSTELSKPEEVIEQVDSRTIAVFPLPYDVKLEAVESFFAQHAKVNSVRLPRLFGDKKHFCGTALIEFSEEEDAKKVLTESLVYAGAELELKPKKDFDAEREKQKEAFEKTHFNKNDSNGSGYPKGLIVAFKLKSISTEGSTEQNGQDMVTESAEVCKTGEVPKSDETINESENKNLEKVDNDEKSSEDVDTENAKEIGEKNTTDVAPQESLVKVTEDSLVENGGKKTPSANDKNVVTREDLKHALQKFGTVKYIDFRMGEESGYIRFEDSEAAMKARAAAVLADEGGLVVKHCIATLEPLSGDAEKEYWSQIRGSQEKHKDNKGHNRGRGRNNRGRFEGKRHRDGNPVDRRSNKAQKAGGDE